MRFPWQDKWLKTLEKSLTQTVRSPHGDALPGFPAEEWQIHTVGLSGLRAIREADRFMESCTEYFQSSENWQSPEKTLLDFGVGWGRIARCFMRDFKGRNIVGCDVSPQYLELSRSNFSTGRFFQSEPLPPLRYAVAAEGEGQYPDASTDFIVAYSVFSHLSEQACCAWIEEFARILKPGGMAAVTTRGRWFFDTAKAFGAPGATGYAKGLGEMFEDFDAARASYDAGAVVHATNSLIGDGLHYGETFIPEAFARREFGRHLEVVGFHQEKRAHPIIVLKKPA
ncbi:MAG: methyltransferase domain-containing protein [Albidovulum sp.]